MHLTDSINRIATQADACLHAKRSTPPESLPAYRNDSTSSDSPCEQQEGLGDIRTAWGRVDHEAVLARFWARMEAIYPQRWKSSVGADFRKAGGKAISAPGMEWARALATLTLEQIRIGLDACNSGAIAADGSGREIDWPPSTARFRAAALEIPPLSAIRAEFADRSAARSAFGLLVAERLDSWAHRQADARGAEELLRGAYTAARAFRLDGGALPVVMPALTDDSDRDPAPATPEKVAAALAEMRAELAGSPPVRWREDRGRWVSTLRTAGDREARATVVPKDGQWRWWLMIAGDIVAEGLEPDGEAAKEAAVRRAASP